MFPRLSTEDIRKFALKFYTLTQDHQAYQTSNNSRILKHTFLSADILSADFNKFGRNEGKK
jgi:hypothetical protein